MVRLDERLDARPVQQGEQLLGRRVRFPVPGPRGDVAQLGSDPVFVRAHERMHWRLQLRILDSDIDEGAAAKTGLRCELLGHVEQHLQVKIAGRTGAMLVASPGFLAANGQPSGPADVPRFATLGLSDRPGLDRWVLVRILQRITAGCRVPRLSMNVAGQTLLDEEFPGFFAESVKRVASGVGEGSVAISFVHQYLSKVV